jgi:predicted nucleic acid-binding protein
MIVLDTNVLSEPMKTNGNTAVAAWLDHQVIENLYLTTINVAELLLGVELLPIGKRRSALEARIGEVINSFDGSRILPFDVQAARYFAILVARAQAVGCKIAVADGQIAAIAASRGFSVATRDTAPFIAAGIPVINPWNPAPQL